MCNLYSVTRSRAEVARLFRVSDNRAALFEPKDAIFPGHVTPIVRMAAGGERELVTMSWRFVLPQPGKAPRRVTNTRDDKVLIRGRHRSGSAAVSCPRHRSASRMTDARLRRGIGSR